MRKDTPLTRLLRSRCTPARAHKLLLRDHRYISPKTLGNWWYHGNIPSGRYMLPLAEALNLDLRELCVAAEASMEESA